MRTLIFILVFANFASDVINGGFEEIVFNDIIDRDFLDRMRREAIEECDEGNDVLMTSSF